MQNIILLCTFILFSIQSKSQKITIIDKDTQKPIDNVYIFCNVKSVISDVNGMFNLSEFKECNKLNFQHPAYTSYSIYFSDLTNKKKILLAKKLHSIDEITISVNKWKQKRTDVPVNLINIDTDNIEFNNPQTSADLLSKSNKIFIQKSQLGGGSPMIRGFAANRVLLVIDGIRLNNGIFRSGNLQNIISIDPNSISKAEVILGPGSVIYGSDAIGGVMNFHTLAAKLHKEKSNIFSGKYTSRFSSANKEITNNIQYNIACKKLAYTGSITYSDFSDLKMGKHGPIEYYRREYVDTNNEEDIIHINNKARTQKFSSYSQFNILQKLRYKANLNSDIYYSFIYSKTSDVPRYDRLTQYKDEKLKYAEWYYGPQEWKLHSLTYKFKNNNFFFDNIQSTFAYQNYRESRNDRKLYSETLRSRSEEVDILSLNIDLKKFISKRSTLFYGSEWTNNIVHSKGYKKNIKEDITTKIASRYPNNSKYSSAAVYAKQNYKLSQKFVFTTGARYSQVWIKANISDMFYDFPFEEINLNTNALSGSIGTVYNSFSKWVLKLNLTTGFRAPNIDDISKVFDSEQGKVVVPNKNLKSEYAYNFEFSAERTFFNKLYVETNIFYTILDNAMKREDYSYNGNTSMMYDGEISTIQAIVNSDKAKIYGISLNMILKLHKHLELEANINYTKGKYKDKSPVRHVPPLFANISIDYKYKKLRLHLNSIYNGDISNKRLALSEQGKAYMYAKDKQGKPYSPSWTCLDFKSYYKLNSYSINFAVENIFDKLYRPYSSGICAPARNIIIGISVKI